jgi:hypothetical protein
MSARGARVPCHYMTFEFLCFEHAHEMRCIIGHSNNLSIDLFREREVWMEKFNTVLICCHFLLAIEGEARKIAVCWCPI